MQYANAIRDFRLAFFGRVMLKLFGIMVDGERNPCGCEYKEITESAEITFGCASEVSWSMGKKESPEYFDEDFYDERVDEVQKTVELLGEFQEYVDGGQNIRGWRRFSKYPPKPL